MQNATVIHARELRRGMTAPELKLWRELRLRPDGLKFRRQHPVGPYVLDFYCPAARVAIEVDGAAHGMGDQPRRDDERTRWLAAQGIRVVRVAGVDVSRDFDAAYRMILAECALQNPSTASRSPSPRFAQGGRGASSPAQAGEGDHAQHGGGVLQPTILYDYHRSSAAYRVRIALNLKGIPYRSVPVSLIAGEQKADAYRAMNPQGLVPTLEIDGQRLTQSVAIIQYLDAAYPLPPLLPFEAAERAAVQAMALTIACDIHPLNNLRVLKYLSGPLGQAPVVRDDWYRHWVGEGFAALEAMAVRQAGQFLWGDAPTMADVLLVPQMYNARRFDVKLDAYPTLLRADAAACSLQPFAAAHPDRVAPAA
ncbi:MAG TPA: maleylacetoacetate isomerase [Sphingomonadaceae bacterium]|nr:maleylacetoacetate isomerase [Sphingomonadaceae bacterium]